LKVTDTDMMTQLDKAAVVYQVVLTKADKVKPTELIRIQTSVEKALAKRPAAHPRRRGRLRTRMRWRRQGGGASGTRRGPR
jgi:GTP-binding protein EngB required for normal cell division